MSKVFLALVSLCFFASSPAYAVGVGDVAPNCDSAKSFDMTPLAAERFRGKVILIDFWATWCPPCKKSMPFLNSTRNALSADGFEVIAINVDEDSHEAQAYLKSNPVDYPQFFDPDGTCPQIFGVKAMPSSYLIDKNGKIRKVHLGFRDEDKPELENTIKNLLSE